MTAKQQTNNHKDKKTNKKMTTKKVDKTEAKKISNSLKTNAKAKQALPFDGIPEQVYRRRWTVLSALLVCLLGVMLANSSLNMALPGMSRDLGISQFELTWIVNIYTLSLASLLFVSGSVSDRYGRKKVMQFGLALFMIGTAYAGFLAHNYVDLLISRMMMGVGAAFVMPTTLSIINNTFPKKERPKAVAIWGAVAGIGMMFGSIVSGLLLENFTWHSVFYFSGILALAGFIFNQSVIFESRDERQTPVDWLGGLFSAITILSSIYTITEVPNSGFNNYTTGSLIVGIIFLLIFIWWERKVEHPMLDMNLFKNRLFSISSIALTVVFFAMAGVMFSISQVLQMVLGYSPLEASLRTIPFVLPMMFVAPNVPKLVNKIGARNTVSIGLLVSAIGFLLMSTWGSEITYTNLFFTMIVITTGVAIAMSPGTNILMDSVPRNRSGMGSAMNDNTREIGGALGVAILGSVLSSSYDNEIKKFTDSLTTLPHQAVDAIQSSLAVALQVAKKIGPAGESLVKAAKEAFIHGLTSAALAAALIMFVACLMAYFGLKKQTEK